jgi:hypothetical protein
MAVSQTGGVPAFVRDRRADHRLNDPSELLLSSRRSSLLLQRVLESI